MSALRLLRPDEMHALREDAKARYSNDEFDWRDSLLLQLAAEVKELRAKVKELSYMVG